MLDNRNRPVFRIRKGLRSLEAHWPILHVMQDQGVNIPTALPMVLIDLIVLHDSVPRNTHTHTDTTMLPTFSVVGVPCLPRFIRGNELEAGKRLYLKARNYPQHARRLKVWWDCSPLMMEYDGVKSYSRPGELIHLILCRLAYRRTNMET